VDLTPTVTVYEFETGSLPSTGNTRTVVKMMFRPYTQEVTEVWRKLCSEKLQNMYLA
jgi:hypothetical protein